jgi:hypothetical protein
MSTLNISNKPPRKQRHRKRFHTGPRRRDQGPFMTCGLLDAFLNEYGEVCKDGSDSAPTSEGQSNV